LNLNARLKHEIIEKGFESACCQLAALSAFARTGGSLTIARGGVNLEITGDTEAAVVFAGGLIRKLFGVSCEIYSEKKKVFRGVTSYTLATRGEGGRRLLAELGLISYEDGHIKLSGGSAVYLTESDCCARSYLAGAFLSGGNLSVPDTAGGEYRLDLKLSGGETAADIEKLLDRIGVAAHLSRRRDVIYLYVKEKESIADFVAAVCPGRTFFALREIMLETDAKNNSNRQANFIVANLSKAVEAAVKQAEAIDRIEKKAGLSALPPRLRQVARLRQEYPDAPLEFIAEAAGGGLTKSGVNHRMRKILKIAGDLDKE
jgi:DNA-binding protein WhiA